MKGKIFIMFSLINILLFTNISYAKEKLPSYYNSVSKKYITSVKNQGKYSTCWAFSTISSIESSLIKNNNVGRNIDLSEAQLIYLSYNKVKNMSELINKDYSKITNGKSYLYAGGNYYLSMYSLAAGHGVIKESKMKYSSLKSKYFNKNTILNNDYYLKNCYIIPMKKSSEVKKCIIKYGSVATSYCHDNIYFNNKHSTYYQNRYYLSNHAVSIVGWNDNYSKNNFKKKPKRNGAWLIKNSWGTNWGSKGYFWISYEDTSIDFSNAVCFEMTNSKFLNRYQYDGTYSTKNLYNEYCLYQSNIYTAKANEILSNIGFFTRDENIFYTIKIYKDVKKIPTDGTLITTYYGKANYQGYHSIKLSKKVLLKKGDKFSIVIQLKDKFGLHSFVAIDCNCKWSWMKFFNHTNPGESFISNNGKKWIDISSKYNANCRIKALTKSIYK